MNSHICFRVTSHDSHDSFPIQSATLRDNLVAEQQILRPVLEDNWRECQGLPTQIAELSWQPNAANTAPSVEHTWQRKRKAANKDQHAPTAGPQGSETPFQVSSS